MVPLSGCCAPERILMSVDLPAPFSPSSAWISPGSTSRPASSSAWTPGNRLPIRDIRKSGSVIEFLRAAKRTRRRRSLNSSDCANHYGEASAPCLKRETRNLFHLIQPFSLIQVLGCDRDRGEQCYLLLRLFAVAQKRYQRLERTVHLAARQLFDGACLVASFDLSKGLGQGVEANQLHFAKKIAGL